MYGPAAVGCSAAVMIACPDISVMAIWTEVGAGISILIVAFSDTGLG